MNNEFFESTLEDLNRLTKEGFFGNQSRVLLERQSNNSLAQTHYQSLMSIFNNPKEQGELINHTTVFLSLFNECLSNKDNDLAELISTSIQGSSSYPMGESLSEYLRYLETKQIFSNCLSEIVKKNTNPTSSDKVRLASSALSTLSDGFEYCMKLLTYIIAILKNIENKEYDLSKISGTTSRQKIDMFKLLDKSNQYLLIVSGFDEIVRNADSHADIRYSVDKGIFIGKNKHRAKVKGQKKTIPINEPLVVTVEEMFNKLIPKVGYFIQGYISASLFVLLSSEDEPLFNKARAYVYD